MTTNELITINTQAIIDGKYRLGAIIRRTVQSTLYETEVSEDREGARPGVIRIRELNEENPGSMLNRWRDAIELSHPNLLRMYATGNAELDGVPVEYEVMERADESLAGVLAERSLSEEEVREMLDPAVHALEYLHMKGYTHGALKASNVMAVGNQLKLSTDSICRVGDGWSTAEDMQALGALISEALGPGDPSERFLNIIQHCRDADVSKRWTVEQLADFLKAPSEAPKVQRAIPAPRFANHRSRRTPKWVFAALAALVLIVLGAAALRNRESAAAPIATPIPVVKPYPAPVNRAVNSTAPDSGVTAAAPRKGKRENGWSVIVAAYSSRDAAEKRMRKLASRWPGFHPSVTEQHKEKAPYIVVLGQNLSEDAAQSLRRRAVSSGLPRDTYIKRML